MFGTVVQNQVYCQIKEIPCQIEVKILDYAYFGEAKPTKIHSNLNHHSINSWEGSIHNLAIRPQSIIL
jgi:hypothetical protein